MPAKIRDQLQNFKTLKIGGGGWLTSHDQHKDGTLVCRTDTYGAYLWNEFDKQWEQLVTTHSMPKTEHIRGKGEGVYEIAIAPSDSSIFYMAFAGRVFRSSNKGTTWTRTKLPNVKNLEANSPNFQRIVGHKMAINPHDPDHVILGTQDNGLWQTRDGGKTWAVNRDVPEPRNMESEADPGVAGIHFDPNTKGVIFACSHGHGFYRSKDNGETFEPLAGGPEIVPMDSDVAQDGTLYLITYDGKSAWRFDSQWKQLTNASHVTEQFGQSIACDPFDANRIIFATQGGSLVESLDRGETISQINWHQSTFSKPDIGWFRDYTATYLAVGGLNFHPALRDELTMSMGIGFLKGKVRKLDQGIAADWTWMTRGVEQLVANQVIALPNGTICVASWDRAVFNIKDPDEYPKYYLAHADDEINHCCGIDWCAQDNKIIAAVNFGKGSGVSRDGMENFVPFEAAPFDTFPEAGGGGEIAVGGPNNFVWVGSNRLGAAYTTDGGESWNRVELPGIGTSEDDLTGYNWAYYLKRHICTADRVRQGTFYLWHGTGVFRSEDGGQSWKKMSPPPVDNGGFNAKMRSVPGVEGHLFASAGPMEDIATTLFARSRDGGASWSNIDGITEVHDFGFGAVAPGGSYPSVWIAGYANQKFGIYRSDDNCESWARVSDGFPLGSLDSVVAIDGDKKIHDRCYIGFNGSGYAYAPGNGKVEVAPVVIPAYMLIPAAAAYRFGKRWSKLKTAHMTLERDLDMALERTARANPAWTDRLEQLRQSWKKF